MHTTGITFSAHLLDKSKEILFEFASFRGFLLSGALMAPSQDPMFSGLGQAVRVSTDLLASLIVGGALGWAIDTYVLDSTPWALVIGLLLGIVAGMRNAYRTAQRWKS